MNKDQISRIRENLLASHPDLGQGRLSDEQIQAAAEKVSATESQKPIEGDQVSPLDQVDKASKHVNGIAETPSGGLEIASAKPDEVAIMNAVLEDLQGDGQNARIDNPDLARYVDQVLKMPRKE